MSQVHKRKVTYVSTLAPLASASKFIDMHNGWWSVILMFLKPLFWLRGNITTNSPTSCFRPRSEDSHCLHQILVFWWTILLRGQSGMRRLKKKKKETSSEIDPRTCNSSSVTHSLFGGNRLLYWKHDAIGEHCEYH